MRDDRRRRAVAYERDRDERGRPANARPRDRFGRPLPRGAENELTDRQDPDAVVETVAEAFDVARSLFDSERFFEAHEFLEFVWKHDQTAPADKNFWKGVTQVAVGCCHVQRGNADGAVKLLERAVFYLRGYPDAYRGVDRAALSRAALGLAEEVRERGASAARRFPRFPVAEPPAERTSEPVAGLPLHDAAERE